MPSNDGRVPAQLVCLQVTNPRTGIQFHPEVTHTVQGSKILENFAKNICNVKADWTMGNFIDQEIARIRNLVGETKQVIGELNIVVM